MEVYADAGVALERVVAVGGGTAGSLWPQIVTDVTGLPQVMPEKTVGASYGDAYLAARLLDDSVDIDAWNPPVSVLEPAASGIYDELYGHYRALYPATREVQHALAAFQRG